MSMSHPYCKLIVQKEQQNVGITTSMGTIGTTPACMQIVSPQLFLYIDVWCSHLRTWYLVSPAGSGTIIVSLTMACLVVCRHVVVLLE